MLLAACGSSTSARSSAALAIAAIAVLPVVCGSGYLTHLIAALATAAMAMPLAL